MQAEFLGTSGWSALDQESPENTNFDLSPFAIEATLPGFSVPLSGSLDQFRLRP
jgi:hypothetical protein